MRFNVFMVFSIVFLLSSQSMASKVDTETRDRLIQGVLKSRSIKQDNGTRKPSWQECGSRIPEDRMQARAVEWVDSFIAAVETVETRDGVILPTWGVFATMANESGFNECTLDKQSRDWAWENGVVSSRQFTYSREDVWKIVSNKKFKSENRKADMSPFQVRFSAHKLKRNTVDHLLTLNTGIEYGLTEMSRRLVHYSISYKRTTLFNRPWMLWPSFNPSDRKSLKYDMWITRLAKWLGAKDTEI